MKKKLDKKSDKKMNKLFLVRMYFACAIWTIFFFYAVFLPQAAQTAFCWPIFLWLYLHAAKFKTIYLGNGINDTKGVIYASNHKGFADSQILLSVIKNPCSILYRAGAVENPFFKLMTKRVGFIPIRFNDINSLSNSFIKMRKKLDRGISLIFFPEGRYVVDTHIGEFHKGIARLAKESGVPVVPVAMYGIDDNVRFDKEIKERKIYVKNGEPMLYSVYNNDAIFVDELKSRISKLYFEMHEEYNLLNY